MTLEKERQCEEFERFLLANEIEYRNLPNGQFNLYNNSKELIYTVWVTTNRAKDIKKDRMTTLAAIKPILECGKSDTIKMPKSELRIKLEDVLNNNRGTMYDCILVVAIHLPTGATEIITNHFEVESNLEYCLNAYDEQMHLKSNKEVTMTGFMLV